MPFRDRLAGPPLPSQQHSIDVDEVECILANLIHQRYIKGYIAHQQRMLVVSQNDPFPALQKD